MSICKEVNKNNIMNSLVFCAALKDEKEKSYILVAFNSKIILREKLDFLYQVSRSAVNKN